MRPLATDELWQPKRLKQSIRAPTGNVCLGRFRGTPFARKLNDMSNVSGPPVIDFVSKKRWWCPFREGSGELASVHASNEQKFLTPQSLLSTDPIWQALHIDPQLVASILDGRGSQLPT